MTGVDTALVIREKIIIHRIMIHNVLGNIGIVIEQTWDPQAQGIIGR